METQGEREGEVGRESKLGTSIQITALDAIVNVNSLFTLAVFIGLAWNPSDPNNSLVTDANCVANRHVAENLVSYHVFSFSSFLFSSLLALGLKQAIRLSIRPYHHHLHLSPTVQAHINKTILRLVILISAIGSVSGCLFLMLALANVVQIKLGTFGCGSSYTPTDLHSLVPFGGMC
ncbi:hypothetical protein MRB53_025148 [Persea americana]|uniref:Uncharacterized protein n=1 Tax=Persea americana TaxID=3435 RepID=A0ACC2LEQ6_PERAE|nr:hypothetical protein MRB53_025148 [Persea americana]